MNTGHLVVFILDCKLRLLRWCLYLWDHRSKECENGRDLLCLHELSLILQVRKLITETQCLLTPNPFVLALNEFIDGLRAGNRQIYKDHKGSLLLYPAHYFFSLVLFFTLLILLLC